MSLRKVTKRLEVQFTHLNNGSLYEAVLLSQVAYELMSDICHLIESLQFQEMGTTIIPVVLMRTLKLRKMEELPQDHNADKWQS